MSGHSKWRTIKHQKGAADAKRGALFTKLSKDIALAARQGGGGDPEGNFHLRLAIEKAKASNMPMDNVTRAIKKGIGEAGPGENFEEITYEGYGPGGAAVMLQALTVNRNRTASDVRSTFNKHGGSLGESGCVAWNFESKGIIRIQVENQARAEDVALMAIDSGADDVNTEDSVLEIYTDPDKLQSLQKVLQEQGVRAASAEISMMPKNTVLLDPKAAEQTLKLLDGLEDLSDVQRTYTNADFPQEVLERYQAA